MSFSINSPSQGVSSLNDLTGALSLIAGTNITITPSGTNITIDASTGSSGANTTLSNLTSPTAINQDLLAASGGSHNIGGATNWFNTIYSNVLQILDSSGTEKLYLDYSAGGIQAQIFANTNLNIYAQSGNSLSIGAFASGGALSLYSNGISWTWPSVDGASGQALVTDGAGNLSWTAPATSSLVATSTQTLSSSGSINSSLGSFIPITATSIITLGATSITNGANAGQILVVANVGSNAITINNSATVDNPGLAAISLGSNDTISYVWTGSAWLCTAHSVN